MFVALRMIALPDDRTAERDRLVAALRDAAAAVPGLTGSWVAPVAPTAVINAGDVIWRATFSTEGEAIRAPHTRAWGAGIAPLLSGGAVTTVGYRIPRSTIRRQGPGIWRALIFRTFDAADPAMVRRLTETTLLLPRYVEAIRSWALSPVAYTDGVKAFTHVWEQEFDTLGDLTGPYMTDPAHWGIADAFFDAEYPEYIVDPQLIQVVGTIDSSILAPIGPQMDEAA